MKIGIMLRHYEQQEGGVKVYTKKILPLLFSIGSKHQYVLMYQNPKLLGTYANFDNVEEVAVAIPGTVPWDQIAVPWVARKKRLDLIFNPKFTVPFIAKAKSIFVLHGSEWFVIPEHFRLYDQWYFKNFVPLYCRKAAAFVAVSDAVKADVVKHVGVKAEKVCAIHNGFDPGIFNPVRDSQVLQKIRQQYKLPEKFILWAGQIESRKNVSRLLQAFARISSEIPHSLVMAGAQRWSTDAELRIIQDLGIQDRVIFTGWVTHSDLPAVYALADLFAFPSLYEGFGIPLLEAMACGCPIVTANTCAPPEVTDGASYLVDPLDVDDVAMGMRKVILDRDLREALILRGIERAKAFSWEKCARQLLDLFDRTAALDE
jgi:glycosyltransferase involved in cell wall biosynthesis